MEGGILGMPHRLRPISLQSSVSWHVLCRSDGSVLFYSIRPSAGPAVPLAGVGVELPAGLHGAAPGGEAAQPRAGRHNVNACSSKQAAKGLPLGLCMLPV